MANLIPIGIAAVNSADFTVVAGTPQALFLIDDAGTQSNGFAKVQIKGSNNQYFEFGRVVPGSPLIVTTPGTYRCVKPASKVGNSFGVDKN